jgi:hypothetical protein
MIFVNLPYSSSRLPEMRGGDFLSSAVHIRLSDRSEGAGSEQRPATCGGRGVLYYK